MDRYSTTNFNEGISWDSFADDGISTGAFGYSNQHSPQKLQPNQTLETQLPKQEFPNKPKNPKRKDYDRVYRQKCKESKTRSVLENEFLRDHVVEMYRRLQSNDEKLDQIKHALGYLKNCLSPNPPNSKIQICSGHPNEFWDITNPIIHDLREKNKKLSSQLEKMPARSGISEPMEGNMGVATKSITSFCDWHTGV